MKKSLIVVFAIALLVVAASLSAAGVKKAKSHGVESKGTITAVDETAKSFTLKVDGTDQTIYWTQGTKVRGGSLKADENVTVRWMEKNGKKMATSVRINPPAKASAAKK